jgi:hypothetical protein
MSEGAEIRRAFDGPDITHDSLIDHLTARIADDTADFYAHASEVENDTVEPIDFGSAAE